MSETKSNRPNYQWIGETTNSDRKRCKYSNKTIIEIGRTAHDVADVLKNTIVQIDIAKVAGE